jgi:5'-3' exonuclease
MPILMDYSQVMLASLFVNLGNHTNVEIDIDHLRHMFLNSLRANIVKFKKDYGEMIICVDSKTSWRRDFFTYYKASRRKSREESELDWPKLFEYINQIRTELDEYFPYKVLHVDTCEADDIIGVLCSKLGTQLYDGGEKILILSSDKDYIQLHKYANVDQYAPAQKKFIVHSDPQKYIIEHVLKGDSGDGVPNVLSPDNCIVIGERQKSMTAKRIAFYSDEKSEIDDLTRSRIQRNKKLIDLSEIPAELQEKIIDEYNKPKTIGRKKLFTYFIEHKLKNLMTDLQDF